MPIFVKPMESPSNKTGEERTISPVAQFRSKPFLTILDDKSALKKHPHRDTKVSRKRTPASPSTRIKKNGTRLQAYAGESAHSFAAGVESAIKIISRLPAVAIKTAREHAATQKPNSDTDSSSETIPERASHKENFNSLVSSLKNFAEKIASLRLKKLPSLKIALFAFIAVISISAGASVLIGATKFPVSASNLILPDEESVQTALLAYLEPDTNSEDDTPSGPLPPVPVSVSMQSYSVKSGDTLERIAKRFGLRQDTVIAANNLQSASSIHSGVKLRIPNMDGISHKVRSGDSLSSLAKAYAVDITRIVDANDLASGILNSGQNLFIPNARLSSASLRNFYGERFVWPARGPISSPFGYRANPFTGLRTYHSAMDIVVSIGTRVKATSSGTVADTGYNSVFGNYIILKHASGYQSLYGHLSKIAVKEGTFVDQGTVIGYSGNTGQSTGPHLHFSIFKNGQAIDPLKYVK